MTEPVLTPLQRFLTGKLIFWVVLIVALVADLATKAWATAVVEPTGDAITPVIDGVLAWKWALNEGAAFSLFDGHVAFLAIVASAVMVAVFVYMYTADSKRWGFLLALGLVASGAIGNLHDRILLGHVRDFIFFDFDLPLWGPRSLLGFEFSIPRRWPVFNVADMAIMLGVAILMVQSFMPQHKPKSAASDQSEPPGEKPEPQAVPEPATAGAEQQ